MRPKSLASRRALTSDRPLIRKRGIWREHSARSHNHRPFASCTVNLDAVSRLIGGRKGTASPPLGRAASRKGAVPRRPGPVPGVQMLRLESESDSGVNTVQRILEWNDEQGCHAQRMAGA